MPCASVVAFFGRVNPPMLVLTTTGAPLMVMVWVAVTPAGATLVPKGLIGTGGFIKDRLTCARRMGVPVSAATTRPRMTPVPVGSLGGRLPGSRTGVWAIG